MMAYCLRSKVKRDTMNYTDGIKKCKQALLKLSSKDDFVIRVDNAFTEILQVDPNETSVDHLKEIVEWCEQYLSIRDKGIKSDGVLGDKNRNKQLADLSQ